MPKKCHVLFDRPLVSFYSLPIVIIPLSLCSKRHVINEQPLSKVRKKSKQPKNFPAEEKICRLKFLKKKSLNGKWKMISKSRTIKLAQTLFLLGHKRAQSAFYMTLTSFQIYSNCCQGLHKMTSRNPD